MLIGNRKTKKRILLCASYSVIEPLGLLHLGGLARDLGWDRKFHLIKDHNFKDFFKLIEDYKPDAVGFNVYTGNHLQLKKAFEILKQEKPNLITIVGGPHATYFPIESSSFASFVVMSEGFSALASILNGEAKPGILCPTGTVSFPHPDRETFYADYPEHAASRIKSIITMTGCPYTCTYCYNSSTLDDIPDMTPELIARMSQNMNKSGRLFPRNIRSVDSVIREGAEIVERWNTEVIYCQDDVHGFDINGWMKNFADKWPVEVGIPYHAQMRWEMTVRDSGKKRLDLMKKAGCFGLTLAIEASDSTIRTEILSRKMPQEIMFEGMKSVIERGFRVRTEQITALPYGGTTTKTPMNLDADIDLVRLNVDLRRETGGPTMAWASTFAPYKGTKLGQYCEINGHYVGDNSDVPDTFFSRSVLRFPKEWIGTRLSDEKENKELWLDSSDLEDYRNKNAELRRIFNFVCMVPDGHVLAKEYLETNKEFSFKRLADKTVEHVERLKDESLCQKIKEVQQIIKNNYIHSSFKYLFNLAPYFACLPKHDLAIKKTVEYTEKYGDGEISPEIFSTAIRHHLYDNVLYAT